MHEKISTPVFSALYRYVGRSVLAVALLAPAATACTSGEQDTPPQPTSPPPAVAEPNPDFINCGALTHLEIDEDGRVLVIEGTESTMKLNVGAEGDLQVDVGNDGTVEETLNIGQETSQRFSDGSTVDMIWNENQWVSLTRDC